MSERHPRSSYGLHLHTVTVGGRDVSPLPPVIAGKHSEIKHGQVQGGANHPRGRDREQQTDVPKQGGCNSQIDTSGHQMAVKQW